MQRLVATPSSLRHKIAEATSPYTRIGLAVHQRACSVRHQAFESGAAWRLAHPRRLPRCSIIRHSSTIGTATAGGDGSPRADDWSGDRSEGASSSTRSFDERRIAILDAALTQVHEHGWTEDAIAAGVLTAGCPLASIGSVSNGPADLVSHFMSKCNDTLRSELEKLVPSWDADDTPVARRIELAIRTRLEMVEPYVKSGRWHEAMAIGAKPLSNATVTASQLSELVGIIVDATGRTMGPVERAAICGTYATTELHMLADDSEGFEDTWSFLGSRINELELMARTNNIQSVMRGDTVVAATAVAASLGGGVLSLAQPAAAGAVSALASSIMPNAMEFMQQTSKQGGSGAGPPRGSRPSDYDISDDLPPFEGEIETSGRAKI